MAIKNLLVAYNGGEASDAALSMAVHLANKYDAHLTGIVAHNASNVTRNVPKWLSSAMRGSIGEITARRTDELEENFYTFVDGKIGSERVHWIDVKADSDHAVAISSRHFDLTFWGQYENLIAVDELLLHPDRIAFESGRPMLVVSKAHQPSEIKGRVVVAWDGRRTAARALFDDMTILTPATQLTIVTVDAEQDPPSSDLELPILSQRHGLTSERQLIPNFGSVATTLLRHCEQAQADLLVTGAYGRSKLSEDQFGGVTSSIVRHSSVSHFLAH